MLPVCNKSHLCLVMSSTCPVITISFCQHPVFLKVSKSLPPSMIQHSYYTKIYLAVGFPCKGIDLRISFVNLIFML